MRWLCGDTWPPDTGFLGFDPIGPWPAAVWVLNAMYERDDMPAGLFVDQRWCDHGKGFAGKPPAPWRRLSGSELGAREGFGFWAVNANGPKVPQADWEDPCVMPTAAWPAVGPAEQLSWPASLLPPTEGSLDAESLDTVIAILTQHTTAPALAECGFYYGAVAFMGEGATVYAGDLRHLPTLVRSARDFQLTPNNIWPADHSWLIYTDYDLNATRVTGSPELVEALCRDQDLDTVRCGQRM